MLQSLTLDEGLADLHRNRRFFQRISAGQPNTNRNMEGLQSALTAQKKPHAGLKITMCDAKHSWKSEGPVKVRRKKIRKTP